ncbi:MAG TPA: methyltransferase domain-containing protein [Gemmatimonadales bacterium]|nr:methyltransferase domain-containing protein [Gemmatimonadales bacterium]
MDPAHRARLESVYAGHPLNADAVIARVRRERGTIAGITAVELAESVSGGPTDQNHAGGAAAVRGFAEAVAVRPGWSVLDIGAGLGGTARLLAQEFGCRCHGVELTESRFRDAVRLTQLVGLEHQVKFSHGDFMSLEMAGGPFDLAIGQGAFMHFPDLPATLRKVAAWLRRGGRLVVEDGVLLAAVLTPPQHEAIVELLHHWNGEFQQQEEWPRLLEQAGFRCDGMTDLTSIAVADFERLLRGAADQELNRVTAEERRGWELGLQLSRSGYLGTVRIIATLL